MRLLPFLVVGVLLMGCGSDSSKPPADGAIDSEDSGAGGDGGAGAPGSGGTPAPGSGGATAPLAPDKGCSDLFYQSSLHTYELEIAAEDWQKMMIDFMAGPPVDTPKTWYPLVKLRLGDEVRTDAAIRLRADSSWRETVARDPAPKAQFLIAFDKRGGTRAFHGIEKIAFDMPRTDHTFLNQRLGYAWVRSIGLQAPCAASAELVINGQPYGLYTSVENWGGRMMKRMFPEAPSGFLLKAGWEIEANPESYDYTRAKSFWAVGDVPAMLPVIDMPYALKVWASEAIVNDADGYWGGEHNFMVYAHPQREFVWISDDMDATFAWVGMMQHPLYWWAGRSDFGLQPPRHYLIVLADPVWKSSFVDAIAEMLPKYDVALLQSWITDWSAQISAAVERDSHRPFSVDRHKEAIDAMKLEVAERAQYLTSFLDCYRGGGADDDQDGFRWCDDCDDKSAGVHPGATEACDGIDNDCDGIKDDGCPAPVKK